MTDLTPETLRSLAEDNERFGYEGTPIIANELRAHADAWAADIRDWHADCLRLGDEVADLRKRLKAAERVIRDLFQSSVKANAGWHRQIRIEEADDE